MARYSMAQVERITGVKSNTLHRWEEAVPILCPLRGYTGLRVYSGRDVEIVLRLKYLICTKGLNLPQAKAKLIDDAYCLQRCPFKDAVFEIRQMRAVLCKQFFALQQLKKDTVKARCGCTPLP